MNAHHDSDVLAVKPTIHVFEEGTPGYPNDLALRLDQGQNVRLHLRWWELRVIRDFLTVELERHLLALDDEHQAALDELADPAGSERGRD